MLCVSHTYMHARTYICTFTYIHNLIVSIEIFSETWFYITDLQNFLRISFAPQVCIEKKLASHDESFFITNESQQKLIKIAVQYMITTNIIYT